MLTCVFLFQDGRVLVDGSQSADLQWVGVERDGRRFVSYGRIGGAMLCVDVGSADDQPTPLAAADGWMSVIAPENATPSPSGKP